MTVTSHDLTLPDGATLHVHDSGERPGGRPARLTVLWHHGTPNLGDPPRPLLTRSAEHGVRWVSWDRPGYGSSTPAPGRDVASAAGLARAVADHLGVDRFATMGHSGGGPHALACGALLPDRVSAVVAISSLAPYDAAGLDHAEGMAPSGVAVLGAASRGRAARERHEAEHGDDYDPEFCDADRDALATDWSWFLDVVRGVAASGPGPAIDDDVAYTAPWGFDVPDVAAPTLVVHGDLDRIAPPAHGRWLAEQVPGASLWFRRGDGHVSAMRAAPDALDWLLERAVPDGTP